MYGKACREEKEEGNVVVILSKMKALKRRATSYIEPSVRLTT